MDTKRTFEFQTLTPVSPATPDPKEWREAFWTAMTGHENVPNSYQEVSAHLGGSSPNDPSGLGMPMAGLAGETGELLDLIKKHLYHGIPFDRSQAVTEAGDVLWYLSVLCYRLGIPLSEVMKQNVSKLTVRYPDGFSVEAARTRKGG